MLPNHGWLFVVAGLLVAMLVSLAIPHAMRRNEPPLTR
jgi:hypothetical protein